MCGNSNSRKQHWPQSAAASSFVISVKRFCDGQGARCLLPHSKWWNIAPKMDFTESSGHQQIPHPLVKFEPGGETFAVLVLEPKEPGFPQPNSFHYLHRWHGQHDTLAYWSVKNRWHRHARHTWSKSCLPVVLGRMANSSSASMVVTRTFICQRRNWRWDSGGHFLFSATWTSLNEQQLVKATAIIALVLGGKLVLWQQNDQKEDSLHFSVQPGASNHKRLVGTTIKHGAHITVSTEKMGSLHDSKNHDSIRKKKKHMKDKSVLNHMQLSFRFEL